MNNKKTFLLNGHKFSGVNDLRIIDILHYFNYKNSIFIIEYNNLICNQKEWSKIRIKSNDTIEIISIVGGG